MVPNADTFSDITSSECFVTIGHGPSTSEDNPDGRAPHSSQLDPALVRSKVVDGLGHDDHNHGQALELHITASSDSSTSQDVDDDIFLYTFARQSLPDDSSGGGSTLMTSSISLLPMDEVLFPRRLT